MESFFKFSATNDVIVVEELVLRKYDLSYVKQMSFDRGKKFIEYCFKRDLEEMLWPLYISDRERMTDGTFISFNDYVSKSTIHTEISTVSTKSILNEVEEIKKEMEDEYGDI